MATKKIEIQDSNGNVYYPHTDASVVKNGSKTVAEQLNDIMKERGYCNVKQLNNGIDLNTITNNGQYAGTNLINAPKNNVGYYIEVFNCGDGSNYIIQRAMGFADGGNLIFQRQKNLTWCPWKLVSGSEKIEITTKNQWRNAWSEESAGRLYVEKNGHIMHVQQMLQAGISTENTVVAQLPNLAKDIWLYVLCADGSFGQFYVGWDGKIYVKYNVKQGLNYNFNFSCRLSEEV